MNPPFAVKHSWPCGFTGGEIMGSMPKGISASRGAAVLGVSEFSTRLEVFQRVMEERKPGWNKRHGLMLPPEPDGAPLRWGNAFENAIVELAQRERDSRIVDREKFYSCCDFSDSGPIASSREQENFITCHIDGMYKTDTLHEGKTTSAFSFREKWGEPGTDHIPTAYQVQVQHQMLCTGVQEAVVSVLVFPETPDHWEALGWRVLRGKEGKHYTLTQEGIGGFTNPWEWAKVLAEMGYFHQYRVKANGAVQKLLVEKYRRFWEHHVLAGIPPEPQNYEDVKRLCPEPKSTLIVPDFIERKLAEYKGITEETASAKNRKERIKTIVTKYAATHAGTLDDESREGIIFRNTSGEKLGSWSKNKNGSLVFRTS